MPYFARTHGRIGATLATNSVASNGGVFGLDQVLSSLTTQPLSVKPLAASTSNASTPNAAYEDWYAAVIHFVYTKAELNAAGWTSGQTITAIQFKVVAALGYPYTPGYAIGMVNTGSASGSALTGLTTVRPPTSITFTATANATNTITLNTPFQWNGTSNLGIALAWQSKTSWSYGYAEAGSGSSIWTYSTTIGSGFTLASVPATLDTYGRPALTLVRA